ncbi:aldo/keto reductase [Halobium palmae]|uniref:Aldo/keto reductase n=1 Tax=Halobium palmae TaxID=1776492 RepID=A0ABD5RWK1_9EURY
MTVPTVTLSDGTEMPGIGTGTAKMNGETLANTVEAATDVSRTAIDTAEGYGNEADLGDAVSGYDRSDLFLTSKVCPSNMDYESVLRSCAGSLDRLGTSYLDLYLVHWPNPAVSLRATLDAMARLRDRGQVRRVGVSNFDVHLLRFARHVSDVSIVVNQVEFHPYRFRPALLEYAADADVTLMAAAPLAQGAVFDDETIRSVAEKHDRSVAQVVLRWEIQHGVVPVPRSSTPAHVRANLDVFDWELDETDMQRIDAIDRRERTYAIDPRDDTYGIAR